jgi:oligoribonuclease NrnB/cAMP/cGMP phosphodiesterase (DHH superfamily)
MRFKDFLNELYNKEIKVFYHNDMDGYGSAFAAWKHLKETVKYIFFRFYSKKIRIIKIFKIS